MRESITIRTQDGNCPATVLRPETAGSWPAVIFFMDGLGIRPALLDMAERLARCGYVVLLPDLYYRFGPYAPMDPKVVLGDPENRKVMIAPKIATTGNKPAAADTAAFIAYLDTRNDIAGRKIGTTGYCMGGPIVMRTAATLPDRIGAGCSFHGGGLNTADANSPHLLIPQMKASMLIAIADNDDASNPTSKDVLRKAFDDAKVTAEIEVYKGANHGWVPPDSQAHHPEQAERAWARKLELFRKALA